MLGFRLDQPVPARVFRAVSARPDAGISGLQALHIQPIPVFSYSRHEGGGFGRINRVVMLCYPLQIRAEFALAAGINGEGAACSQRFTQGTTI